MIPPSTRNARDVARIEAGATQSRMDAARVTAPRMNAKAVDVIANETEVNVVNTTAAMEKTIKRRTGRNEKKVTIAKNVAFMG